MMTGTLQAADGQASKIIEAAGVKGGLVVHVGCGDGKLTAALRANDRYLVRGLERDAAKVAAAREHIRSLGVYGKVSVEHWRSKHLPLSADMVNLLVVEGDAGVSREEMMRVLAPLGVLVRRQGDKWTRTVKPWPDEIDEWSHYLHDSGNNAVADDDRVGPPERLQWQATPLWCRSHEFASSVHAMVTAKGRMFAIIDEGIIGQPRGVPALWTLIARDAFNGVLLWKRPWNRGHPHALTAAGDRLYAPQNGRGPLCILDAATGKTLHTCKDTGTVSEIAVCEGKVILNTTVKPAGGQAGKHVVAADAADGKVLWATKATSIASNTLVAGGGRVCYFNGKEVVCLRLSDGKELWRTAAKGGSRGYVVMHDGAVYLTGSGTLAVSAETGKQLWKGPNASGHARNPPGLFVASGLLWRAWAGGHGRSFLWQPDPETRNGYDPKTGKVTRTVTAERLVTAGHHIRCYPPKATKRYLLLNKRGVEFFDLVSRNHMRHNWMRGACGFGVIPANGLLYVPPHQCFCYPGVMLTGLNALGAKMRASDDVPKADKTDRLTRGPAYGKINRQSAIDNRQSDWPTYRHDARRSGSTTAALTAKPASLWTTALIGTAATGGKPEPKEPTDKVSHLVLRAADATVHGSGAKKSGDHISAWRGKDTYITWRAKIQTAGRQTVWICQSNAGPGGSVFELAVGEAKLTGRIRHTNGWTDFVWVRVGQVNLAKTGALTVSVRPVKQVERRLGNVKAVAIGPDKPPGGGPSASLQYVRPEQRHGALTPPVAAGGRVFVAEPDAHTVHCVDAGTGKRLWHYIAGARVDSPPTIHGSLVLFGCTDGHVYCLRASDGALVWRFRAAPKLRQVCIRGQLESAWPVHGSVLVRSRGVSPVKGQHGQDARATVYFTAGRSSYLDGGITAYALDPATGKVIHERHLASPRPDTSKDAGRPFDMTGTKTDILVAGAEDIYMFQMRFNADLTVQPTTRVTKLGDRMVGMHLMTTDGFLDKTWFNRTYWVYGQRWPGYYFNYLGAKSGQILAFDESTTYGLKVYRHRRGHSPEFTPGDGYELFADRNTTISTLRPIEIGREKGRGFSRTELPIWSERVPIRAHGMVLAGASTKGGAGPSTGSGQGKHLYIAGPPDLAPDAGAFEAMTGRRGSVLRVMRAADGSTLSELKTQRVPVFDGLIAAGGRLYMATMDGALVCLGEKEGR